MVSVQRTGRSLVLVDSQDEPPPPQGQAARPNNGRVEPAAAARSAYQRVVRQRVELNEPMPRPIFSHDTSRIEDYGIEALYDVATHLVRYTFDTNLLLTDIASAQESLATSINNLVEEMKKGNHVDYQTGELKSVVEPFCQKHTFFPEDTQVDRIMLEFTGLESLAAIARDEKHDLSEFRKKVNEVVRKSVRGPFTSKAFAHLKKFYTGDADWAVYDKNGSFQDAAANALKSGAKFRCATIEGQAADSYACKDYRKLLLLAVPMPTGSQSTVDNIVHITIPQLALFEDVMLTFLDGHTQVPAQGPLHTNFTNNYRALAAMIARRQSIYVTPLGDDGGA